MTTAVRETDTQKKLRRAGVREVYDTFPFLRRIYPENCMTNAEVLATLPHDFRTLPHQPDGTAVERIYFLDKDGKEVGTVGTTWQRFICALTWNYKRHETTVDTLRRLGQIKVKDVEYVVLCRPERLRIYRVPRGTDLWRMYVSNDFVD